MKALNLQIPRSAHIRGWCIHAEQTFEKALREIAKQNARRLAEGEGLCSFKVIISLYREEVKKF